MISPSFLIARMAITEIAVLVLSGFCWRLNRQMLSVENSLSSRPSTKGRVIAAEIKQALEDLAVWPRELCWMPAIEYEYQVSGQTYAGSLISNNIAAESVREFPKPTVRLINILERYPIGSDVTVFYDPENPEKSILEINKTGSWFFFLMAIWIFSIGSLACALQIFKILYQ